MEHEFGYEVPFSIQIGCQDGAVIIIDGEGRVDKEPWTLQEAIQEAKAVVRRKFADYEWVWDLKLKFRNVWLDCGRGEVYGLLELRGGIPHGRKEPDQGASEFMRINRLLDEDAAFGEKALRLNRL